jgi:hypothetical protein
MVGLAREPSMKGFYLAAFHRAAGEKWGEDGLRAIRARMPPREAEEAFAEHIPVWVPERVVIAWCFALWEGPADRKRPHYVAWLQRHMDLSFGRVRKWLIGLASPHKLVEMAGDVWKRDHTSGTLTGAADGKRAVLTLQDHPYVDTPQGRATIAEIYRYSVQLTRAKNVTETHALVGPRTLEVRVRWL